MELKEGKSVIMRVRRSGLFQRIVFRVRREKVADEEFLVLYTDRQIDLAELERLANENDVPIRASNALVFPRGKSAHDFRV